MTSAENRAETSDFSQRVSGDGAADGLAAAGMPLEDVLANNAAPADGGDIVLPPPSETSMEEYYQLQKSLLGLTVTFGAVVFPFVWFFYSWQIAVDYFVGAWVGVVYLRMLAKNVSTIGRKKRNSSIGRLTVFAGVIVVALRWEQLDVVPVFLGFLTYKAAIFAFVLWTSVMPRREAT